LSFVVGRRYNHRIQQTYGGVMKRREGGRERREGGREGGTGRAVKKGI
jgi:hypothetical protein